MLIGLCHRFSKMLFSRVLPALLSSGGHDLGVVHLEVLHFDTLTGVMFLNRNALAFDALVISKPIVSYLTVKQPRIDN